MDPNYNVNRSLNDSGTYNVLPQQSNYSPARVWTGSYPNMHQMQQLNSMLGNVNLEDSGTNYLDAYMAMSQNGLSQIPNYTTGQYYMGPIQPTRNVPQTMPNVPIGMASPGLVSPTALPNNFVYPAQSNGQIPIHQFPNAQVQNQLPNGQLPNPQLTPTLTPEQLAMLVQLQSNIIAGNSLVQQNQNQFTGTSTNEQTQQNDLITSIPLGVNPVPVAISGLKSPDSPLSPTSNGSDSGPHSPRTPNNNSSRRQLQLQLSEVSSNTSSSIPGSPTSVGACSLPENVISPLLQSPDRSSISDDIPKGNTPSRSKSLKYSVKYPQDKCYKCMKKVYPMEKIGPVKDAMYHKACFICHVCGTRLSMKNYYLNKEDIFDNNIYCKSHQPEATGKGGNIDTNSILIKGAMSVPKLNKVNEQIRGDDKIHIDSEALDIVHARTVPVQDLQTANKIKEKSWTKEQRKSERMPPPDVVRYEDPVPEYDMESYERYQVENNPDYDTR